MRKREKMFFIKRWILAIHRKISLYMIDQMADLYDARCWMLFPPSFYLTHTQEEIDKAEAEELAELREMIDNLED